MQTAALILNIIMLLGLIPAIWMAIMSPMMFGSGATKRTWILVGTVVALPILIIISQIFSWIAYNGGNYDFAFKISLLPLADILLLVILFLVSDSLT